MATRVYSNWISHTNQAGTATVYSHRYWYDYTVSVNNNDTYTLTLYPGFDVSKTAVASEITPAIFGYFTIDGSRRTYSRDITQTKNGTVSYQFANSFTYPITKGTSARSAIVKLANSSGSVSATHTFAVPARTSYNVTYDARTGTGAPATQKKYYGQSLTLSTARPTKNGYTFLGWATTSAAAAAGTKNDDYDPGDTMAANVNSATSLYAVWERTYTKPTISNVRAERCLQDGTEDDEGGFAKVTFDWSVFRTADARYYGGGTKPYEANTIGTCTVTVGDFTESVTSSLASASASVVLGNGTFDTDTAYLVTVTLSDSETVQTSANKTTTSTVTLSTTYFPMDFNEDATAVGFFQPAPDDDEGMFIGKDLHIKGNLVADYIVERGTSGNWSYRKYNSGVYEAWYTGTATTAVNSAFASASPVLYQAPSNLSIDLPFAVSSIQFVDVKMFYANWGVWTVIHNATTSSITFRPYSALSRASATYAVRAYIKGSYPST